MIITTAIQIIPCGILALIAVLIYVSVLNVFFLHGSEGSLNNLFEGVNVNAHPLSKDEVEKRQAVVNKVLVKTKMAELSTASLIFSVVSFFSSIITIQLPHHHPFYNNAFSSFVIIVGFFAFIFLCVLNKTKFNCNMFVKGISFVGYGDVRDRDISLIRSVEASRNYLKAVALSEREITNYELDMLTDFAHKEKEKERREHVIEIIKK